MIDQTRYHLLFLFIFFLSSFNFLVAQEESAPEITLASPYNSVYVHLYYLQSDSYQPELAARTFTPRDSLRRIRLAKQLKQIYDGKGLYVHLNLIPEETDYIDSVSNKAFYTPFPDKLPEVYLEKINGKWYYSSETAKKIPQLHKQVYPYGTAVLLNWLPRLGHGTFLGLEVWQYLSIALLIVLSWLVYRILRFLIIPIVRRIAHSRFSPTEKDVRPIIKIGHMISLIIIVWFLQVFVPVIQLPIHLAEWAILALNITLTVFVVVLLLRIVKLLMIYAEIVALKTEQKLDEQILPILRRILEAAFIIGGAFNILSLLDVNVTALIAGVSIGGLALALAAQDTVKNLIGSALIFVDRPFQIGDYITGSGFEGTVKEVGFRTTRIQKVDTSIISVPNGTISNMVVTNLGLRVFRMFNITLSLTYNTPPEKIEEYIAALRQLILDHPDTSKETYYVYFRSMEASSLDIMFRAYLDVPDYATELSVKEDLFLRIIRLASKIGVEFAFPTTTVYLEK